jgi:hypothetical protein
VSTPSSPDTKLIVKNLKLLLSKKIEVEIRASRKMLKLKAEKEISEL